MMKKIITRTNYKRGKIYKIICNNKSLIYFGSTTRSLKKRFQGHYYAWRKGKKKYSSYKLFDSGGVKIKLVEKYPCRTKKELEDREGYYIMQYECVNVYLPGTWKKVKNLKQDKNDEVIKDNTEYETREEMDSNL